MADLGSEKKHAPTPRRRQRAREQGQVARSNDLTSAVLLLAAIAALWLLGGRAAGHLAAMISENLTTAQPGSFNDADAAHLLAGSGARMAIAVTPLLLAMMVVGVLINISQTGFLLLPAKLLPSLTNVSPAVGAGKIFSLPGVARIGFGVFKVVVVASVAYVAIGYYGGQVMHLAGADVSTLARSIFHCLLGTCFWIAAALFVLSLADYGFQWWKHERDLMMTDEELREEMRETEGDPAITDRRRQLQRTRANRSEPSTGSIPKSADVIITAKSGVAIAIKYNPRTMLAPIVVAKGRLSTADTIQHQARLSGIPVVERALLAEHQYRTTNVGEEISADQYQAVAEVLRG